MFMTSQSKKIVPCAIVLSALLAPALRADDVATRASIRVNTAHTAAFRIPGTIYGSFLEPIGNSTYGGLWAEILSNGSFEDGLWSASAVARMIEEEPALARGSQLGLPLPWEPLYSRQGNRYEPRWGDAANSSRSLVILGLPNEETGVLQKVYLPVHRELKYSGSLYAKHLEGAHAVEISVRKRHRPDEVIARTTVDAATAAWTKYNFRLTIPSGVVAPLEPVNFVISVHTDARVTIDQVSLMPADNIDGLDPEVVAMARAMKTPLVRFGGNFTSAYHWRDGVGPRDKRIPMLNIAWGIPEYNQFGTDEFLEFCKLIGAQPQIALNLGGGTPEEAAAWVRYVDERWGNRRAGLFWELGNELWGDWNLGYPTLAQLPGRTRAFSEAVRAVDPGAKLIATGQDPDGYQTWNAAQLTNPAGTFNYLSTHFVVTTSRAKEADPTPEFLAKSTFALPVELGRRLRAMDRQIDGFPAFAGKTHIAFTEWLFAGRNGTSRPSPSYDNMGGAVAAAGFFNMLMRNADIVPVSDMTGIVDFAGIWKNRGRVYGTPSYYAFRMYSNAGATRPVEADTLSATYDVHGGITRLPEIQSVPYLDAIAALDDSGNELTLFCVNRRLNRDIDTEIFLDGFTPRRAARVKTLRAASIYDVNSAARPEAVTPVVSAFAVSGGKFSYRFPPSSVTVIQLEK